jgi:type II secretory pathway pseudopilin PulG
MKRLAPVLVFTLIVFAHPGLLRAQTLELDYSTYLGRIGDDRVLEISLGMDGAASVVGYTNSSDFPMVNPYQAGFGGSFDAFVTALSSTGSALYYSTYLGGSGNDYGLGISLGTDGRTSVTGFTESSDFPMVNPYQAGLGGNVDAFVSTLSSTGSALSYSTYLGGSGGDLGLGISLGMDGAASVTGFTESSDFPTENPYQAGYGGNVDVFVTTLSPTGSALAYSTYLGGSGDDHGYGISLGTDGRTSVTGYTGSSDFPTENPYQAGYGGGSYDVFVSALSSTGLALSYSTYLGGSGRDEGYGISLGTDGRTYITGFTESSDFPMENPYQAGWGESTDVFVTALSSTGSALYYSTYLGGSGRDEGYGISLGTDGRAYVIGRTESSDFPTKNPYQAGFGESFDAFVSALSSTGSALSYSTYLGGSGNDYGLGISLGTDGRTYITGFTESSDFPTENPYQAEFGGGNNDAFVSRLAFVGPPVPPWITDFNGDGTSDIAIFRGTSGLWAIRGITRVYFGSLDDLPVPGDYAGNSTTDIGIFRSSSGLWAIRGVTRSYFGSSLDTVVPGDYNGDGECDMGIFRDSSGLWAIKGITRAYFGGSSDSPVPGYYNGDSIKDIGIFREASGLWAIKGISRVYFGSSGDETVPGDYNGDGAWDYGVFRSSSGLWAIRGVTRSYFGSGSDQPVPADYKGDGRDDIGIFRGTSGLWAIRGVSRVYFGSSGDVPVTR